MKFRPKFFARVYRNPEPGDDGGGAPAATTVTTTTAPADTGAASTAATSTAAPAAATTSTKPGSMLEAMFGQTGEATPPANETPDQRAQRVRDEAGRFAKKPEGTDTPPAQKAAVKTEPAKPEGDPKHKMPDGLTEPAQKRFQELANSNKELAAQVAQFQPIVESALGLQTTFRENGIRREQFDQAMSVVGMMNKGDLRGALKAIDDQRAMIAMALGEPVPGADPLAKFPDLKQAVENLQLTEQHALEMARARTVQYSQSQQQQRQRTEQDNAQQQQQAIHNGQVAVDKFCVDKANNDLDFARIEPMLLEQIKGGLLNGVPPNLWAGIVEKTYGLIKQSAAMTRGAATTTSVLRPTGGESPRQAPKSMHEAMWGSPQA